MKGYSKMRLSNEKTRSVDFSDLLFSLPTQETNGNITPNSPKHQEASKEEPAKVAAAAAAAAAVKLSRACSVAASSSSSSPRTTTGIQSAVKRVFSMRRSSSVSERYCRIYDQHVTFEPAFDDDDVAEEGTENNGIEPRSMKMKRKKKNGILKACKRLLGF